MRSVKVWDLPTRLFHWALAIAVGFNLVFGDGRPHGVQFVLHVSAGYLVALLLLFRVAWGFVGGEFARFGTFLRPWPEVVGYLRGLLRLKPPRVLGHNPIGGWMIALMLAMLTAIVLTGLLGQAKVAGAAGPLSGMVGAALVKPVAGLHSLLASIMIYLVLIHLAGVAVESLIHRENLTLAMITGRKPEQARGQRDANTVPRWRAAAAVIFLILLAALMAASTRFPAS